MLIPLIRGVIMVVFVVMSIFMVRLKAWRVPMGLYRMRISNISIRMPYHLDWVVLSVMICYYFMWIVQSTMYFMLLSIVWMLAIIVLMPS